ncbi:MAG: hypothetical protein AAFX99_22030 [Myxococcota bacterium]
MNTELTASAVAAVKEAMHDPQEADALATAPRLRAAVGHATPEDLKALKPLQRFLVMEVSPNTSLPSEEVAEAYCAALSQLPSDWWGSHGALESIAAERLIAMPGRAVDRCLMQALKETTELSYLGDGESNTEALDWGLTVADLAAEFLARRHDLPWDGLEPDPDVRAKAREVLRRALVSKDSNP